MIVASAGVTAASAPWWYLAALAGGFTVLGALISVVATWAIARRKNRLDDYRRFEPDIIEIYVKLDEFVDTIHNNALGDPAEEKQIFWDTYRETIRLVTRLELITSRRIYDVAKRYRQAMWMAEPNRPENPMPELVETIEELRTAIRKDLRIPR